MGRGSAWVGKVLAVTVIFGMLPASAGHGRRAADYTFRYVTPHTGLPVALEKVTSLSYDIMTVRVGNDSIKILVDDVSSFTVRANTENLVFSPTFLEDGSTYDWDALSAFDQAKVNTILGLLENAEKTIEGEIAVISAYIDSIGDAREYYDSANSTVPGCGLGGAYCSGEAWDAMMAFLGCTAGELYTATALLRGNVKASGLGLLISLDECNDWDDAHSDFVVCCHNSPGGPGGGDDDEADPEDPEPCEGCLPPDQAGPNPECCAG